MNQRSCRALILALGVALALLLHGCGGGGGGGGAPPAIGEPPAVPNTISGVVKTSAGAPIAGATVTISTSPAEQTTTAADGTYGFWVAPGDYTLRAEKTGFQPAQVTVTLQAGETITKDIALSP
jgi:hypothetical protein